MIDGMQYLSEDIQRIVIENGWSQFTPIQKMSFKLTKESDYNLILMGPTGCGKTEAALFPILSKVDFSQPGVKILYISPLRALINDQTKRFEELGVQLDFRVTKWHMDAKQSEKASLVRNPEGALLITPESLEAMFQNHPEYIKPLFQSLDYVIVDEIHVFCGTDRGVHLQSLLSRLRGYCNNQYRFYGLSATIGGDLSDVKSFVGDFENTKVLKDDNLKETDMTVDYFPEDEEETNCEKEQVSLPESNESESQETGDNKENVETNPAEDKEIPEDKATENDSQPSESEFCETEDVQEDIEKSPVADKEIPEKETTGNEQLPSESESREAEAIKEYKSKLPKELIEKLKGVTDGKNALVFCNSRGMVEEIAVALKGLSPDMVNNIFSHHAAISKSSRESTEQAAKEGLISPYVICCTNTLELGIDIGNLDMICQVDSTYSVSSLIQRVGRSGRRGGKATIYVCCSKDWNLIRSIACCNMYRNGMIEAPRRGILWYNVVLQQILSIVREKQVSWDKDTKPSKLSAEAIAETITSCDAFSFCTKSDVHKIIEHLMETTVLEELDGELIIGEAGKNLVGRMDSYTAFSTPHNYRVMFESNWIGEFEPSMQVAEGSCFLLGAKVWQVASIDSKKYVIHVKPAAKGKKPNFISEAAPISREIEQEMQRLCTNQEQYPFVSESCLPIIHEKRQSFEEYDTMGSLNTPVCNNGGILSIFPFQGTRIYNTLILLFNAIPDDYALRIGLSREAFISKCREFLTNRPDIFSILQIKLESGELRASAKLEKYLPLHYQAKLESTLKYDLDGTLEFMASLLGNDGDSVPTTEESAEIIIESKDDIHASSVPEDSDAQNSAMEREVKKETMEGDVYVLNIWAGPDWNRQLKDDDVRNLLGAQDWLIKEAKKYGKNLKFHNFDALSGSYQIPASYDSSCTSLSPLDYLKEMGFTSEEQFMDFVKKETVCDKAIILVISPEIGRSYACGYNTGDFRGIASLFFTRGSEILSGVICHEILHLFNAPDLYEEEQSPEVVEYVRNKYPNEVMLGGQGEFETMELSPITAYYLGLCSEKDEICDSIKDNRH